MDAEQLLESLTPGGSEFHGDPQRCADWVRRQLRTTGKIAADRNAARRNLERMTDRFYDAERRGDDARVRVIKLGITVESLVAACAELAKGGIHKVSIPYQGWYDECVYCGGRVRSGKGKVPHVRGCPIIRGRVAAEIAQRELDKEGL